MAAVDRRAGTLAGPSNHGYLAERLHYDEEKLLDADSRGVMMTWEGALATHIHISHLTE